MLNEGNIPFDGTNARVRVSGTFDARQYVDTYADLLSFTPGHIIAPFFFVTVGKDPDTNLCGQYQCVNAELIGHADPAVVATAWKKVGGLDASGAAEGTIPQKQGADFVFVLPSELDIFPPVVGTHAEILARMNEGKLVVNKYYKITTYQTRHIVQNSEHLNVNGVVYTDKATWLNDLSEGTETLIVQAASNSTFTGVAYSVEYPGDILEYDITDVLCEDGTTPRPGRITYRKERERNIIAFYDWRKVVFIRYAIAPPAYNAATTYAKNNTVEHNGSIFVALQGANTGNWPDGGTNDLFWFHVLSFGGDPWGNLMNNRYIGLKTGTTRIANFDVVTNGSDYRHFKTFSILADHATYTIADHPNPAVITNIEIGKTVDRYNNIIFCMHQGGQNNPVNNLLFEPENKDHIFGAAAYRSKWGHGCTRFIAVTGIYRSTFDTNGYGNIFRDYSGSGNACSAGLFGPSCGDNIFNGVGNTRFGGSYAGNKHKLQVATCEIAPGCGNNTFHHHMNRTRTAALNGCTMKGAFSECTISGRQNNVTFEQHFQWTTVLLPYNGVTLTERVNGILPDIHLKSEAKETPIATVGTLHNVSTPTEFLRFFGAGAVTVTGFSGSYEGKKLKIVNHTTDVLTFAHEHPGTTIDGVFTGSTAINRITTKTGASVSIAVGDEANLVYSTYLGKWIYLHSGGSSNGPSNSTETLVTPSLLMHDVATPTDFLVFQDINETCTVTGFSGGVSGREITIFNHSVVPLILKEDAASGSLPANKIYPHDKAGANGQAFEHIVPAEGTAVLKYLAQISRWVIKSVY